MAYNFLKHKAVRTESILHDTALVKGKITRIIADGRNDQERISLSKAPLMRYCGGQKGVTLTPEILEAQQRSNCRSI